jgi:hypothetical protein
MIFGSPLMPCPEAVEAVSLSHRQSALAYISRPHFSSASLSGFGAYLGAYSLRSLPSDGSVYEQLLIAITPLGYKEASMHMNRSSAQHLRFPSKSNRKFFHRSVSRKIISLVLLLGLLVFPITDLANQAPSLASFAIRLTANYSRIVSKALASFFTTSAATRQRETTAERTASVTSIRITPAKIVGYTGQPVKFSAVAATPII